jgi:hypothetical protein
MDVSGVNNPNFGNSWNETMRENMSKITRRNLLSGKIPKISPQFGENNSRFGKKHTTYKDKEGNTIFTDSSDPRVISGELTLALCTKENVDKMAVSKLAKKVPEVKGMSRSDANSYIYKLLITSGKSPRAFSKLIGLHYGTVLSINKMFKTPGCCQATNDTDS